MEKTKITAKDMEGYLAERYCGYEWVFLPQVRSSTGSADRIADGMAFNMYRSTGYTIAGFEIKVSRSDWLSELKSMSKSNEIMSYCDVWYLVVSDINIIQDGELPKNWGLLVLKDGKLVQKVRPTYQKPVSIPLSFMASILRRSGDEVRRIESNYIKKEDITDEIKKAEENGYERARGYNGKRTDEALKNLRELVLEFEKASGIELENWRGKEYAKSVGMYVKFALELGDRRLDDHSRDIEQSITSLQKSLGDIKKIKSSLSAPSVT